MPEPISKMAAGSTGESGRSENSIILALSHPLATFLAGIRFLSIIPISWNQDRDGRFFRASLIWFPVIGLLIGGVTATLVSFFVGILPGSVCAFLAIVLLAGISGCLHLDGVADSFDGLLSSRPRTRALEIMRDSHIGAMGVIAIVFLLLGKFAALSSLSTENILQVIILMPMAGRTAIVLTMAILPYAREEDGLGMLFYSSETRKVAVVVTACTLMVSALISIYSLILMVVTIMLPVTFFAFWCHKKLGGATGDTLGAVCELTELSVAVGFCLLPGLG